MNVTQKNWFYQRSGRTSVPSPLSTLLDVTYTYIPLHFLTQVKILDVFTRVNKSKTSTPLTLCLKFTVSNISKIYRFSLKSVGPSLSEVLGTTNSYTIYK